MVVNNSRLGIRCGSKIRKVISIINTQKQTISPCPECKSKTFKKACL